MLCVRLPPWPTASLALVYRQSEGAASSRGKKPATWLGLGLGLGSGLGSGLGLGLGVGLGLGLRRRVLEDLHRVRRTWRRAAAADPTVAHRQRTVPGVQGKAQASEQQRSTPEQPLASPTWGYLGSATHTRGTTWGTHWGPRPHGGWLLVVV